MKSGNLSKEESRIRIPSAISSSQLFPHFPFKSRQVMHPPQESENFWRSFRAAGMAFSLPSGAGFERMSPSDTAMALATPQISPVATPAPESRAYVGRHVDVDAGGVGKHHKHCLCAIISGAAKLHLLSLCVRLRS